MFDLSNKTALVIGGRGYLGRDFCQKLRAQNANVISADLPRMSNAAKSSNYIAKHDDIPQYDVDVEDRKSIIKLVQKVVEEFSSIDIFIYSVTSKPEDFYLPFSECSIEGWNSVLNIELSGLFMCSQEVGKVMEHQKSGSMIFISSIYGVVGNDQRIYKDSNLSNLYGKSKNLSPTKQIYSHSVYPAVKGGVISFARYLAAYWGEKNIRVNTISPGGVYHTGENSEFLKKYSEKVPLGRKAEVEEISSAAIYLASNESSYVTGQNLIIDGGWTAW